MKFWLPALGFAVCSGVLPMLFYDNRDAELDILLDRRVHLMNEIATLKESEPLPEVSANWYQLKHYVALFSDLVLMPANNPESESTASEHNAWHGILSGDLTQLLAVARRVQDLMPVYFGYFSFDNGTGNSTARLNIRVLGQTGSMKYPG